MSTEKDLIIIGAGAAGIGAGLQARAAGLDFIILEAAGRIGGRAHTVQAQGYAYDLGCHYLHSASQNVFALQALTQGARLDLELHAEDVLRAYYRDGQLQSEAERQDCAEFFDAFFEAVDRAPADVAASGLIDRSVPHYDILSAWCAAINGVPPERLSTHDVQKYVELLQDWPVKEGYGALITGCADGLPVRLNCPVSAIDRSGSSVTVVTPDGSLQAKSVVVTLSPAVLKSGAIRFTPGLPDALNTALDGVQMGYAERVALIADRPFVEEAIYTHVVPKAGKGLGLMFQEFDQPIAGAYIAGDLASGLAREGGREALIDYAEVAACEILGSDFRKRILQRVSSCWSTDPLMLGGYSAALPGRHADRAALRASFDERVVLAGEACSPTFHTTAHGAYESGINAVSSLINRRTVGTMGAR